CRPWNGRRRREWKFGRRDSPARALRRGRRAACVLHSAPLRARRFPATTLGPRAQAWAVAPTTPLPARAAHTGQPEAQTRTSWQIVQASEAPALGGEAREHKGKGG